MMHYIIWYCVVMFIMYGLIEALAHDKSPTTPHWHVIVCALLWPIFVLIVIGNVIYKIIDSM